MRSCRHPCFSASPAQLGCTFLQQELGYLDRFLDFCRASAHRMACWDFHFPQLSNECLRDCLTPRPPTVNASFCIFFKIISAFDLFASFFFSFVSSFLHSTYIDHGNTCLQLRSRCWSDHLIVLVRNHDAAWGYSVCLNRNRAECLAPCSGTLLTLYAPALGYRHGVVPPEQLYPERGHNNHMPRYLIKLRIVTSTLSGSTYGSNSFSQHSQLLLGIYMFSET